MKKWNKPELLNLMLQGTKTQEDKGALRHNCLANNGNVFLNKSKCYNKNSDNPDTCRQGHGNLVYADYGFLGKELVSCCGAPDNSTDNSTDAPYMS